MFTYVTLQTHRSLLPSRFQPDQTGLIPGQYTNNLLHSGYIILLKNPFSHIPDLFISISTERQIRHDNRYHFCSLKPVYVGILTMCFEFLLLYTHKQLKLYTQTQCRISHLTVWHLWTYSNKSQNTTTTSAVISNYASRVWKSISL